MAPAKGSALAGGTRGCATCSSAKCYDCMFAVAFFGGKRICRYSLIVQSATTVRNPSPVLTVPVLCVLLHPAVLCCAEFASASPDAAVQCHHAQGN